MSPGFLPPDVWTGGLIFSAAKGQDPEVVRAVVELGFDVRCRDEHGATPLHHAAAWSRDGATIRALVESGADFSARDDRGRTVIHHAGLIGAEGAARSLLELGADPYVFDGDGLGPTDRRRWRFHDSQVREDGVIELVESRWPR